MFPRSTVRRPTNTYRLIGLCLHRARTRFLTLTILIFLSMLETKPLTPTEMSEAADMFFECLGIVRDGMPEGSTVDDTLKVMEHVAKLATKLRNDRERDKLTEKFGFSKQQVCS